MKTMMKEEKFMLFAGGVFLAAAAFCAFRSPRQLPLQAHKGSKTVEDEKGHYDMDGVSYDDSFGVVVSSDGRTPRIRGAEGKKGIIPHGLRHAEES